MKNSEFKRELEIRYSEELYLGYSKGNIYHFFYAYKRIIIEIMKSFVWLFGSLFAKDKPAFIGIYATNNQLKALKNAKYCGVANCELFKISSVSFCAGLMRLLCWILKFMFYPFFFIFSNKKASLYFTLFSTILRMYNARVVSNLLANNVSKIYLSNDHAGDIFVISILLRELKDITVVYIQHGAVKNEFPVNYFDEIFVYSEEYRAIYSKLSLNPRVKINVNSNIQGNVQVEELNPVDYLFCLSHQFPYLKIASVLKKMSSKISLRVAIRFHPSDKFALLKFYLLKVFYSNLILSTSATPYKYDFERAKIVLCASSSLLIDAYNSGLSDKLLWVKEFGLSWDYYDLENKIRVINRLDEIDVFK